MLFKNRHRKTNRAQNLHEIPPHKPANLMQIQRSTAFGTSFLIKNGLELKVFFELNFTNKDKSI